VFYRILNIDQAWGPFLFAILSIWLQALGNILKKLYFLVLEFPALNQFLPS